LLSWATHAGIGPQAGKKEERGQQPARICRLRKKRAGKKRLAGLKRREGLGRGFGFF
jgi:hypothetical protein